MITYKQILITLSIKLILELYSVRLKSKFDYELDESKNRGK